MLNPFRKAPAKTPHKCGYADVCYLAEAVECFGYKSDCPLYVKSNAGFLSQDDFHRAVDLLIDKTKAKHMGLL